MNTIYVVKVEFKDERGIFGSSVYARYFLTYEEALEVKNELDRDARAKERQDRHDIIAVDCPEVRDIFSGHARC